MPGFCFETFKSCLGEFLLSSGCFAEASSNASGLNHSIHGRRIPTAGALSSSLVLVTGDAHSGTKCRWLAYRAMVLRDDMAPVEDDDRAVTVTCSTENLGRDKLVLVSCGIDLTHYCANPICLWQHNADWPVVRSEQIDVQGDKLVARVQFPPAGVSTRAGEVLGLILAGSSTRPAPASRRLRASRSALRIRAPAHASSPANLRKCPSSRSRRCRTRW